MKSFNLRFYLNVVAAAVICMPLVNASAAAAAAPSTVAVMPQSAPDIAFFTARYGELYEAVVRRDTVKLRELLAPDFYGMTDVGKVITRSAYLGYIASVRSGTILRYDRRLHDLACTTVGCTVHETVAESMNTRDSRGNIHHLEMSCEVLDLWKARGAQWMLANSITTHLDETIDMRVHIVRSFSRTSAGGQVTMATSSTVTYQEPITQAAAGGASRVFVPSPGETSAPI